MACRRCAKNPRNESAELVALPHRGKATYSDWPLQCP